MKTLFVLVFCFIPFLSIAQIHYMDSPGSEAGKINAFTKVEPPAIFLYRSLLQKVSRSAFQDTFDVNFSFEAEEAFRYAEEIWTYLINSPQPITILAKWDTLKHKDGTVNSNTLAFTTGYKIKFSDQLDTSVYYPLPLAEALTNNNYKDITRRWEIIMTFNRYFYNCWYYGKDGNTPGGKYDFVSVVLHEIAHGLGFTTTFKDSAGIGSWGDSLSTYPIIYDTLCTEGDHYNWTIYHLIDRYSNNSTQLGNALTTKRNIRFDGRNSYLVNNKSLPILYTDSVWKEGSSISHLDDSTYPNGTANSLMKHVRDHAEAVHSPGDIGLSILKDIGWSVERVITVYEPKKDISFRHGDIMIIKWSDSEGGFATIDLVRSDGFLYKTIEQDTTSNIGSNNSFSWTIGSDIDTGSYRIKMSQGFNNSGLSNTFRISNKPQTQKAQFSLPSGQYNDTLNVAREVRSAGERELLLLTIRLHALRHFPQLCDVREANGTQQGL